MKSFREAYRLLTVVITALSIGLIWCGCATNSPDSSGELPLASDSVATNSPAVATNSMADPVREALHVGDAITVSFVMDQVNKIDDHKENIKEDGTITLHLIGPVQAAGKTASELQKEIQAKYVPAFYKRLTVVVKTEGRFYSVGGEVKRPDKYAYITGLSLLGAIQGAGDFTDFANRKKVQIYRTNGQKIMVDCKKAIKNPKRYDVQLQPGDVIHVPRSLW